MKRTIGRIHLTNLARASLVTYLSATGGALIADANHPWDIAFGVLILANATYATALLYQGIEEGE